MKNVLSVSEAGIRTYGLLDVSLHPLPLDQGFTDCAKSRLLWTSFTDGLGFFWMQLPKLKTNSQIYSTESNASFTDKEFLALAMAFNLLLSNLT